MVTQVVNGCYFFPQDSRKMDYIHRNWKTMSNSLSNVVVYSSVLHYIRCINFFETI